MVAGKTDGKQTVNCLGGRVLEKDSEKSPEKVLTLYKHIYIIGV